MVGIWVIGLVLGGVCIGFTGWLGFGVVTLINRALYPQRLRSRRTPASFGAAFEEVRFPSQEEDLLLSGWFVPAQVERVSGAVILCHGMSKNREQMLSWAEVLWSAGYHVLLFDFRALGESEGDRVTGGYLEAQDVIGAAKFLAARPDCVGLSLGVFGFSMGGSAAILAAAAEPGIRAVVTHGAYATLDRAITQRCRHHFGLFAPLAESALRRVGAKRFPLAPSLVAPLRVVSCLSPRPLLILHGECDGIVLIQDACDLYASAGEPKTLRLLANSRHRAIDSTLEADVQAQVVAFFHQNLAQTREFLTVS